VRVVAVDVLRQPLEAAVERLRAAGLEATALVAEISSREGNEQAIAAATAVYGGLDVFHANAAIQRVKDCSIPRMSCGTKFTPSI
jgi:NAD(P)-dependent dehydrogenase (short-subunit alcohol dehydrogenase family)